MSFVVEGLGVADEDDGGRHGDAFFGVFDISGEMRWFE